MNREFDRIIEKLGVHNNGLINCVSSLTEMGCVFEADGSESVAWCEENVQELLKLEESVTVHIAAFEEVKKYALRRANLVDDDSNVALVETFKTKVADLNKKNHDGGPRRFHSHPKYKSFKQKVWQVNHPGELLPGDDSDFVVKTTQGPSLKCPITKMLLVNPVTKYDASFQYFCIVVAYIESKNCGHHYSRDAIQNLIQNAKRGQTCGCPITGCSAKVTSRTLEENRELEVLVQKELLKQQDEDEDEEDDEDIIDI